MPVPSYLVELKEREIQQALRNLQALPQLNRVEVSTEETCPVCLISLEAIIKEHDEPDERQEGPSERAVDSSRVSEMTGVVKLCGCGHVFCRRDLAEWIESYHGSCPTCRRVFFAFTPIDEAEYESSDGGEYVPDEDEEDDLLTDDGEFDLVATSDIDYDMDDDMFSDEELEDAARGSAPVARLFDTVIEESAANARLRASLAPTLNASARFRAYSPDQEDNEVEEDNHGDELDDNSVEDGALSYGSNSPSSEETSFNTEDGAEHNDAIVKVVTDEYIQENDRDSLSSSNKGHAQSKERNPPVSGPSDSSSHVEQ